MTLYESKKVWSFRIISSNSRTKMALLLRCIAVRCNNTGDPTCIIVIQICIKSHFSDLSLCLMTSDMSLSIAGVPKKFRLKNLLKKIHFVQNAILFFGEVLVVMCSKHKRNFKNWIETAQISSNLWRRSVSPDSQIPRTAINGL